MPSLIQLFTSGGFTMYPLLICSLLVWAVIFERIWRYRKMKEQLQNFHLEALNAVLRKDFDALRSLCRKNGMVPTAQILQTAIERLSAKDQRLRKNWIDAVERKRMMVNLDLRKHFWILGTIASSAPFIGLGGTVVGILQSFNQMAQTGSGGFATVASGISQALVATAAGIIVAVIAVLAFNAFQTRWSGLILQIKVQTEELVEILGLSDFEGSHPHGA